MFKLFKMEKLDCCSENYVVLGSSSFSFFFFSLSLSLFNLFTIYRSSFHLGSAQSNVRKYVGISNCLNIARTSYKVCFQYCDLTLTDPIKENALLVASNMSIVTL